MFASSRRFVAILVVLILTLQSLASAPVHAALIGTPEVVANEARAADLQRVGTFLGSASVQERLVALGVEPATAQARVSALTDAELARLATEIDSAPAGGDVLALVGVVFVVLLLLEITGVIDIFKKV